MAGQSITLASREGEGTHLMCQRATLAPTIGLGMPRRYLLCNDQLCMQGRAVLRIAKGASNPVSTGRQR